MKIAIACLWILAVVLGCSNLTNDQQSNAGEEQSTQRGPLFREGVLTAGFVCTQGVYNYELVAPFDVIQHSYYRDNDNYIRCVVITEDGATLITAEGLKLIPDHSFENAPPLDILIIPSSEHSMEKDLANTAYIDWLKKAIREASFVMSLCDGAFPLAATGVLDGRSATTFPGDRDRFAEMFPKVTTLYDANFVVDGKYITSVGGALSYEPAFYLVEEIYGTAHAKRSGQGLVLDWDRNKVPHRVFLRR